MREILFRAYQKNFKRMLPVTSIEFEYNNNRIWSITVDNRGVDGKYDVIPYYSTYIAGDEEFPLDSLVLMQYVGLKDKNGVKIFEGDILEDEGTLFTVFYADGGFAIESNPKYFGYGYQDNLNPREPLSDMQMGSYVEDNCEVVGNIHDNKALLGNDR